jgi:hypothetical protein
LISAKRKIKLTTVLCEGLGAVLDKPGKHMYKMSMDEEWKALQEDARNLNKAPYAQPKRQ